MKYFIQFIREHPYKSTLAILLLIGQVVGTLLIPKLIATLIDDGILNNDFNVVFNVGCWMLLFAVLTTLISTLGSWITSDLGSLFGREMRTKLFKKTQEISIKQFDSLGISSLITRSTSDITNLQQTVGMFLQMVLPAPIILLVSIIMTASVNTALAIIQFIFIFLLFFLSVFVIKKSSLLSRQIQARLDRINQVVRESVTGIRVIRAFGNESYEEERCNQTFEIYADNMIRLNRLFAIFFPAVWALMGSIMVVVLAVGGAFSLLGVMEIGQISAVTEYAILSMGYCIMAVSTLTTFPKSQACLHRLQTVLDTEPLIADAHNASDHLPSSQETAVEFIHVNFSYSGAEQPVLSNVNFKVLYGQTTAIIGSTGSGKSTLVDLLLRIHEPQSGTIKINTEDAYSFTQKTLRETMGYVPQKAFLFSGTISENLRLGNSQATDEDLWAALEIAQAKDFVLHLDDQLESVVSQGGTNFSGGQRQRLSIARALVKKSSILLFDDCFSALDVKTDKNLRRELQLKATSQAKIIVAQRVSSILDADQILVLDHGELVGNGTHADLLQSCSVYRSIVESQMDGKEVQS